MGKKKEFVYFTINAMDGVHIAAPNTRITSEIIWSFVFSIELSNHRLRMMSTQTACNFDTQAIFSLQTQNGLSN